jgi:hypothetical protein
MVEYFVAAAIATVVRLDFILVAENYQEQVTLLKKLKKSKRLMYMDCYRLH